MVGRTVLGRYRVVRRLARGGMGVVYLARSEGAEGFARPIVVKRILPSMAYEDSMAKMFIREARILSNLNHPNIVSVLDFAQEGDAYVMVIDYVHGYHLGNWAKYCWLQNTRVPALLALHVVIKVLDALHHAHTMTRADGSPYQIVHRDVSPANIHLSVDGQVKLLDFGIARVSRGGGEYQTEEVALKGKLPYIAPELFRSAEPSPKSDLYAAGVMLHELLVGENEFRGKEMSDTIGRVVNHHASSVAARRKDVPERIDEILARALAKDPYRRFSDAGAFARELRLLRAMAESDADAMLAKRVAADFTFEMSNAMGLVSLDELDDAWRNPPKLPSEDPPPAERTDAGTTRTEIDLPYEANHRWMLWLAAAMVLVGLGGYSVLHIKNHQSTTLNVIKPVKLDKYGDPIASDDIEPLEPLAGRSVGETIEETVAKHLPRFGACKQTHHPNKSSKFTLFFEIGPEGAVTTVHISPSETAVSSLGKCYERVAKKIRFPEAVAGLTGTVPITIN